VIYTRILTPGNRGWKCDKFEVLSADLRTTLSQHNTMQEAIDALEREVKLEKLSCPTGNCED
jgi:hypothetical protein